MTMEAQMTQTFTSEPEFPIAPWLEKRRSLRSFADQDVEQDKINSLFEAARWTPSANNEQPWCYVYATRNQPELYAKLFDALNEGNKLWAGKAPLLVLSLYRKNFARNNAPNASALYDLGAANAMLSVEATRLGLNVHQMGGFDRERARGNLNILDTHAAAIMMAIGYPGDAESLQEPFKTRETAPRQRFLQQSFVLNKTF
jgi:nitroreductase